MTDSKIKKTVKIVFSWLAVIACMVAIFCFSAQNSDDSQSLSEKFSFLLRFPEYTAIIRKLAHYLEYTLLGALLSNAFYQTSGKQKPFISLICGALYAASDEYHQLFVDGRAGRVFDVFIDCLGVVSGILFFFALSFLINRLKLRRISHD